MLFNSVNFGLTIALLWGLILALNAWKTYEMDPEEYENALNKWRLKKQIGKSITIAFDRLLNPR